MSEGKLRKELYQLNTPIILRIIAIKIQRLREQEEREIEEMECLKK